MIQRNKVSQCKLLETCEEIKEGIPTQENECLSLMREIMMLHNSLHNVQSQTGEIINSSEAIVSSCIIHMTMHFYMYIYIATFCNLYQVIRLCFLSSLGVNKLLSC